jgi:hypothetical protein
MGQMDWVGVYTSSPEASPRSVWDFAGPSYITGSDKFNLETCRIHESTDFPAE